jgi:hypothetical protein
LSTSADGIEFDAAVRFYEKHMWVTEDLTEKKRNTGQLSSLALALFSASRNAASNLLFTAGVLTHTLYSMLLRTSSSL